MPHTKRMMMDNGVYHFIARGNRRAKIFRSQDDFHVFLHRLKLYRKRYCVKIYGYCLMPNHVHIVGQVEKQRDVSRFMHGLLRSYTAHFNKTHNAVGHLWQGRFISRIILKDRYAIGCINYVEFNPVRAGLVSSASEYAWSSYLERNHASAKTRGLLSTFVL